MNQTQRNEYLEAFGVPDFLYGDVEINTTQPDTVSKIKTQCLVVEVQNSHSFCLEGSIQTFLFKMLGAIGLQKIDIKCISIEAKELTTVLERYEAKTVLLTDASLEPTLGRQFFIHHPSKIVENDTLKREAWEVLKQVKIWLEQKK